MNIFFFLACTGNKLDSSTSDDTDTESTSDTAISLPSNPSPFTLEISGAQNRSLVFDEPTCSSPTGSSNMRMFWRNKNDAHVFVLVTEILGGFDGVGSYSPPDFRANIKLQEEAGGEGLYYGSSNTSGVEITYDIYEENFISGSATATSLEGNDGSITISPPPYPLWCDNIER